MITVLVTIYIIAFLFVALVINFLGGRWHEILIAAIFWPPFVVIILIGLLYQAIRKHFENRFWRG